ncbi:MAG TPA: Ig-like domain-containing protein, partial [Chryseosolibacter sp.]|nr:Ig-like domain-containing protein [Chryseosolibacter sp.]
MFKYLVAFFIPLALLLVSCDPPEEDKLALIYISIGAVSLDLDDQPANKGIPVEENVLVSFSHPLDPAGVAASIQLVSAGSQVAYTHSLIDNNKTVSINPSASLENNTQYEIEIRPSLRGKNGERFNGHKVGFQTVAGTLHITSWAIAGNSVTEEATVMDVPLNFSASFNFSAPLDPSTITSGNISLAGHGNPGLQLSLSSDARTLELQSTSALRDMDRYELLLSNDLRGQAGETFAALTRVFYTTRSAEPKYPVIADDDLLTLVQQRTFRYFWDFGHPVSGMARERNSSGDIVTIGGTGFGLMAIIVGIERGFITRTEGLERFSTIVDFLTTADRFHGAWPHWMNGATGDVVPFSANDNGGDL